MNKNLIAGILERKTQFKKEKFDEIKIADGKIEFGYLRSIIKIIKERTGKKEFSENSAHAWIWKNIKLSRLIDLFTASPKEAAEIRAEIIAPQTPRNVVKLYIANLVEVPVEKLDETAPITSLTLPVCGNEKESYRTTVIWCEIFFRKTIPENLVHSGNIGQLIDFLKQN